jgi:hypothetical protein
VRSLIERLKRLFERKQYWFITYECIGDDTGRSNKVIDFHPALFWAWGGRICTVVNAIPVDEKTALQVMEIDKRTAA